MSLGSERETVQNPFLRYAQEAGWIYLPPEDALRQRGGEDSPLLRTVLLEQLQRLNPGVVNSVETAEAVMNRLARVRPTLEGNLEAWEYLRGTKTVFVPSERRERNLRLLDLRNLGANTFHVTEEFRFVSGPVAVRADVVLFVNGIPVVVAETKAAVRPEGIAEALDQLRRYHEDAPELMAQAQLVVLTNLSQFFYGPTWSLSRRTLFNWRDEVAGDDFETLVKTFVTPRRILRVLTDFILFVRRDGELSKVVLRPHQMRAAGRVVQRAGDAQKRRGLVWHTQGSGKTYTMITAARHLLSDPRFENPTVLMVVDRTELQQQLFQALEAVGFPRVHVAESKKDLRRLFQEDVRGLIVSMIHKFDRADMNLNTRKNIFVLVDEAHRSTGGDLGNYLMGALPNATFLGFTGTPIDKSAHGRGTFKVFGCDDPKGYLDKYSIRESIEDGTTVPLHYQPAPNELIVDQEAMEREFWAEAELEGVADVEELNRVLDRAVTLKNMLKNPDRVNRIAQFVAEHFTTTVQPMGYKAFLVAVDREACCLYKQAIDRYLPAEMSHVVISRGNNDSPVLRRYHLRDEEEAGIRRSFRKPDENPQILIVTQKLLTGYDAPILYCMYLDKPMRDHVLLQAIARVNRPYEEESRRKTNGLIVDFVGVFANLERALAFDSQDVAGVVEGLDTLRQRFADLMELARDNYLGLVQGASQDKAVEAVLERFRNRELREEFYAFFRELEEGYEILSPDLYLGPFLDDYRLLAEMYRLLRGAFEPHVPVDKSFLRKTAEIVKKHTAAGKLHLPHEVYQVGVETLRALAAQERPETVKVFNLLRELYRLVEAKGNEQPYLIPIGARAEAIRNAFENHQISSQQALEELSALVRSLEEAEREHSQSDLSPGAVAVVWWLRVHKGVDPVQAQRLASALEPYLQEYAHWVVSAQHERELRHHIYRTLMDAGIEIKEVVAWAQELLILLRRVV